MIYYSIYRFTKKQSCAIHEGKLRNIRPNVFTENKYLEVKKHCSSTVWNYKADTHKWNLIEIIYSYTKSEYLVKYIAIYFFDKKLLYIKLECILWFIVLIFTSSTNVVFETCYQILLSHIYHSVGTSKNNVSLFSLLS